MLYPANRKSQKPKEWTIPVCKNPAPTTNNEANIHGAGLLKPTKNLLPGNMPLIPNVTKIKILIPSIGSQSPIKRIRTVIVSINVAIISQFKAGTSNIDISVKLKMLRIWLIKQKGCKRSQVHGS